MTERQQLEQAIAAQESLRGSLDDAIIDATIAAIREKLAELEPIPQQRKLATILFMDIARHTAMTADLDPEIQMEVVDTAITRMSARVGEHGGHVARYQGDGFKAVFGLPVAQENDPERAIRAGLAIQSEAARIARELEEERGIAGFQVRVGISTGLVFSGGETEGEDTIKGRVVNLAARLESAVEPGIVLISHESYKHVMGIFDFKPLEPIRVKGFAEPVKVYQVLRAKRRPFYRGMRGVEGVETQMVGREVEFLQLQKTFHEALEDGERAMITVMGEAGLGKSRLLYEFENWVGLLLEEVELFKGRARLETQGQPYSLIRDLFASRFQIADDDRVQAVREKLVAGFQEALGEDKPSEMKSHIIGQLLGYDFSQSPHLEYILDDPQQLRDQALNYMVDYFKAKSIHNPVLVLLEDLHWADDSSLDAFNRLAMELRNEAVLIVGTARHVLLERRPNWGEGQSFHLRILLEPLSKRDGYRLVAEVLQKVQDLPESLVDLVVINAEGNPFYVEEMVKMLIEDGVIVRNEPFWWVETNRLEKLKVPPTLTGVLQARLDGLPPEERKALQGASVVGRVFWDRVLEYINASVNEGISKRGMTDVLEDLRARELIFRRETSAFAEAREHIFKHALLWEVTYESVIKSVRQTYHEMVAEWLIDHVGDRESEFLGQIADHLVRAQNLEKAFLFLQKAGKEAISRFANEEAVSYFCRALVLAKEVGADKEELKKLYLRIGRTRELNLQWDLALETYEEMEQYSHQHGDRIMELASLIAQTVFFTIPSPHWQPSRANTLGEKALNLAHEIQDQAAEAKILWGLCLAHYYEGNITQSIDAGERSVVLARKLNLREQLAQTLSDLGGICYVYGGHIDQAFEPLEESINLWRELGNVPMLANNLSALCNAYVFAGHYPQAITVHEEALKISQLSNNVWGQSYSQYMVGRAYWERGEVSQAIKAMQESVRLGELSGFKAPQTYTRADLATVFGHLGVMDLAIYTTKKASGLWPENELYPQGVLAHLYVLSGEISKAEAIIEKWKEYISDTSNVYLHVSNSIFLAKIELAIKKGIFDHAQSQIASYLKILHKTGWLSHIPYALYLHAQVLIGLNQTHKAQGKLLEARSKAEYIGSRWMLWKILAALDQLEIDPGEREKLRKEAKEHVEYIANHINQFELQASFLDLPEVQSLYV